jgi:hypothetical protein
VRIAYFINTFNGINWGGQATSNGIQYLLSKEYPGATFVPLDLPELNYSKVKILRWYKNYRLIHSVLNDDEPSVIKILEEMRIPPNLFSGFSHVCFNGEGAIHGNSGHIPRLMALLYMARKQGLNVASVNQTIDFPKPHSLYAKLLVDTYNKVDFLSVREPLSLKHAQELGIKNIHLIPDAVYGLPKLTTQKLQALYEKTNVNKPYIAITGSSILKKNHASLKKMEALLRYITKRTQLPIVFLANAKTDIWIAHKLQKRFDYAIIEPPVKYETAISVIANATMLIGGRQHPNIFAYMYDIPYIPLCGNTHKNEGVGQLQNYPIAPLSWDCSESEFEAVFTQAQTLSLPFKPIKIEHFAIFNPPTKG